MNIEQEIEKIKQRNTKVEADKAWEVSRIRKLIVAFLTYFVMICVMFSLGLDSPFIGAIIPTLGFLLSTVGADLIKKIWVNKVYKK
ncbi:MAG: hypothetical protein R3Y43_03725 [Alphaproteobacteria bacterium]